MNSLKIKRYEIDMLTGDIKQNMSKYYPFVNGMVYIETLNVGTFSASILKYMEIMEIK